MYSLSLKLKGLNTLQNFNMFHVFVMAYPTNVFLIAYPTIFLFR